MAKYRPKQTVMYAYGTTQHRAYITCYPQSRWKLVSKSDCKVELMNKNITICLKPEDFERSWVEAKESRDK
jgi:hypothetical protein